MKVPEEEKGVCGCRGLDVSLSGALYQFPPHIFQLKSVCELGKMKGLKFEKLLDENPLCGTFSNQWQLWFSERTTVPALSYFIVCIFHLSLEVSSPSSDLITHSLGLECFTHVCTQPSPACPSKNMFHEARHSFVTRTRTVQP